MLGRAIVYLACPLAQHIPKKLWELWEVLVHIFAGEKQEGFVLAEIVATRHR